MRRNDDCGLITSFHGSGRLPLLKLSYCQNYFFFFLNVILDIPKTLLNRLQLIINNFIWGNKRQRVCFVTSEKSLSEGGLAVPNLKMYYHAALLAACIEWLKWPKEEMLWLFEQDGCVTVLENWLIQDHSVIKDLTQASRLVKLMGKIWSLYRRVLVPLFSSLQKFLNHPEFRPLKWQGNLALWANKGFLHFKGMLIKGQFPAFDYFS